MKFLFRLHDVIKIPGKAFEDLSLEEVAWMIEADTSISPDGNEYFAGCALDEFLHNTELKRRDLKELQEVILDNIYIDVEGSREKRINTEYLIALASELKYQ
ncbi:hypothetical protein [Candidatus Vondammii sp. HM_W22]|uniref:hypothetical protein n=1 Tax=Candidatus Vondammii sp. HM_W22 TaxID=2687299 RepID=UPI001F13A2CB|nr:hypothetical protein [Candidatus Vondammii sp. HM_W22]